MPHFQRFDRRIITAKKLVNPLQLQLNKITNSVKIQGNEYWDTLYADDAEHIVGIAFIILQNYINGSISDLYPELEKLHLNIPLDQL